MAEETMMAGADGAPAQPTLGTMARILGIFTSPARTFEDIRKKPNFIQPWLVIAACSLLFTISIGMKITWEQVQQNQLKFASKAQLDRLESLTPEQRAQQMKIGTTFLKVISYGFSVLILLGGFIAAGVYMMIFNFGAGAKLKYRECLAIVVYSDLPGIVRALLGTVVVWMGADPEGFTIQNPVPTNLGWFLNFEETPRFLWSLATSLDVVKIWAIVVMAIGFSVFTRKSKGTAMLLCFLPWVLLVLIGAAFASLFS